MVNICVAGLLEEVEVCGSAIEIFSSRRGGLRLEMVVEGRPNALSGISLRQQ
jgi:hypothetical protein